MTPEELRRACERAARYRRELAIEAGRAPGNLTEIIDVVSAYRVERIYPDGWVHAGYITDTGLSVMFKVRVHRDTGRVQVEAPPNVDNVPEADAMAALNCYLSGHRAYRADPRYRYWLEGIEYAPIEAKGIATARGNTGGWIWTRRACTTLPSTD